MSKVKSINYYATPVHKPRVNSEEEEGAIQIDPTQLTTFMQSEHPVYSRAVIFDQEINEVTATMLRAEIMQKASEGGPDDPIYLFLGSPGGGLYESLAIYDTFQMISNPIIAICSGKVMSGGILILLGCDVRLATRNTTFMIHHGHTSLTGNVVQLEEQVEEIKSLNDRMLDIIIKETKISREQLKSWLSKDHYMSVVDSVLHGLIHSDIESLDQLIPCAEDEPMYTLEELQELERLEEEEEEAKKKASKKKATKKKAKKKVAKKAAKKKVSKKKKASKRTTRK